MMLSSVALAGLVACTTQVPYSNPELNQASAQRDAALAQPPSGTLEQPAPVTAAPINTDPAAQPLPGGVIEAVNDDPADIRAAQQAAAANSGVAPVDASPSNPPPVAVNDAGISQEQDFGAVSNQRSIESDAQRIANNRSQYTLIEPTALPTRPGSNLPNIVEYALRTDNPVGAQLYRRTNLLSAQRHTRNCGRYQSPDEAQTDFLARGGPERDRRGLDPDGDGFACTWDPTPFRTARQSATPAVDTARVTPTEPVTSPTTSTSTSTSTVIEPLVISTE
jgi:hypothetical protein